MITFGPIPSRRLGRSLGINNIPPKVCSYSCIYCQVGRTMKLQPERREFYSPEQICHDVQDRIKQIEKQGESVDFLSFVPDGEPTLDINLGHEIEIMRFLGIRLAVFTNSSLLWREDVRRDLARADWVSLKIDSVFESIWHEVDRPHRLLQLPKILEGIREFAASYTGELVTETMLLKGLNDHRLHAENLAALLSDLRPQKAYISIPTRPPAESWVQPPDESHINDFYQTLKKRVKNVEYLIGYEGNAFAHTGRVEDDILSITSVHPMREEAMKTLLKKNESDWSAVRELIDRQLLLEIEYEGHKFYLRRFSPKSRKALTA